MKGKVVIAVLLAYFSTSTQGLQCFTCGHVNGLSSDLPIPPPYNEPSCRSGSTPNDRFAGDCGAAIADPICASAYATIMIASPINKEIDVTIRGCLENIEELEDGCQRITVADMLKFPNLDPTLKEALERLNPNESAEVCTCNTDKCNVGGDGGGGGSNVSRIAQILFLCPLLVLLTAKFS